MQLTTEGIPKCANPECDNPALVKIGKYFYCGKCVDKYLKKIQENKNNLILQEI